MDQDGNPVIVDLLRDPFQRGECLILPYAECRIAVDLREPCDQRKCLLLVSREKSLQAGPLNQMLDCIEDSLENIHCSAPF